MFILATVRNHVPPSEKIVHTIIGDKLCRSHSSEEVYRNRDGHLPMAGGELLKHLTKWFHQQELIGLDLFPAVSRGSTVASDR